jgi:hypothetical protein
LNWYLQSRVAPTVRPSPLVQAQQQPPPPQHPSASLRSVPAAQTPLHNSSAFTPSTFHSSLREFGAEREGRALFALPQAKRLCWQGGSVAAASKAEEPANAQVRAFPHSSDISEVILCENATLKHRCRRRLARRRASSRQQVLRAAASLNAEL